MSKMIRIPALPRKEKPIGILVRTGHEKPFFQSLKDYRSRKADYNRRVRDGAPVFAFERELIVTFFSDMRAVMEGRDTHRVEGVYA